MGNMKTTKAFKRFVLLMGVLVTIFAPVGALAVNLIKADNNTDLGLAGSWTNNVVPSTTDILIWDSTVATPANCTNTGGVSLNVGGIVVSNPAADVKITVGGGVNLGTSGIVLSGTRDLCLALAAGSIFYVANGVSTWNIASGRTVTIDSTKPYMFITSGGGTLKFNGEGTVAFTNGAPASSSTKLLEIGNGTLRLCSGFAPEAFYQTSGRDETPVGSAYGLALGNAHNAQSVYDLSGGTLIVSTNAAVGSWNASTGGFYTNMNSTLIIRDAGVATITSDIWMGGVKCSNGVATVSLRPGGTLSVGSIKINSLVKNYISVVEFDGGILKPMRDTATFLGGLTQATLSTNGAVIDTAGFNVTIAQPFINAAGQAGRLVKLGAGTLNLTNAHTFTGPVVVSNGVLCVTNGASIASTSWMLQGGTLRMRNNVTLAGKTVWYQEGALLDVIGTLTLGGTLKLPKFTAKKVLLAQASSGFSGETSAVTVDAPSTYILKKEATQLFAVQQTGTLVSIF
jgi:autotransporter-associated beta strand protein